MSFLTTMYAIICEQIKTKEKNMKKYQHKSGIAQMFFEGRGTGETLELTEEYHQLLDVYIDLEEKFEKEFLKTKDASDGYRKVVNAIHFLDSEECYCFYREGFRFGVLMGLDIAGFVKNE